MMHYELTDKQCPVQPSELIAYESVSSFLAVGIYAYLREVGKASFEELNKLDKIEHPSSLGVALQELMDAELIEEVVAEVVGEVTK